MVFLSHSWNTWAIVYKADDGKIIEASENNTGGAIYAIFENHEDYNNYARPKTIKELFEQW